MRFTYEIDVPFTENLGRRCVPACTTMILDTLIPGHEFSAEDIEHLSGFSEGKSTWAAQHLLSLNDLGIEVGWIQDEDLADFAAHPDTFIAAQIPDPVSLAAFKDTNDLTLEASRIGAYLERGLPFAQREATFEDITTVTDDGYMVRLEVNGKPLAGQPGVAAHAVVVSAFNKTHVRLENPDGVYGQKPRQVVTWEDLATAWDEPTMQYYRLP